MKDVMVYGTIRFMHHHRGIGSIASDRQNHGSCNWMSTAACNDPSDRGFDGTHEGGSCMPYSLNLEHAEMAVAYVDEVMRWPAANRKDDVAHRKMHGAMHGLPPDYKSTYSTSKTMMKEFFEIQSDRKLWHGFEGHLERNIDYFLTMADIAMKHGVGRCDQLAAVAFKWLVQIKQVSCSVSYYAMRRDEDEFHAFLILGETQASKHWQPMSESHSPSTWPMDAVWCDPWRRDWFQIKDDWRRRVSMIANDCDVVLQSPLSRYQFRCEAFSPASDGSHWRHR